MSTFQTRLDDFARRAIPDAAGAHQRAAMLAAFCAGACAALGAIKDVAAANDRDDDGIAALDRLDRAVMAAAAKATAQLLATMDDDEPENDDGSAAASPAVVSDAPEDRSQMPPDVRAVFDTVRQLVESTGGSVDVKVIKASSTAEALRALADRHDADKTAAEAAARAAIDAAKTGNKPAA